MRTFVKLVAILLIIEALNCLGFLLRFYSTECLILVNAILLAVVSIVCVYRITVFSHNFRTVLKTLGAINQVSTESKVKQIVWITVTGNIFFLLRAFMETVFAGTLVKYWIKNGNVVDVFQGYLWDDYVLVKHWSEVAILALMLFILQSRFTSHKSNRQRDYRYTLNQNEPREFHANAGTV